MSQHNMNTNNFDKLRENDWLIKIKKLKSNTSLKHIEPEILDKIFEVIEGDNWCVEFGADDGKRLSNTWNLLTIKGWSGVLIEADKKKFVKLTENYKDINRVICFKKFVNFSGPNTIDNILSETEIPQSFDLLSIDIDGNDYHIWDSIKKYTPKVVIIEFNPSFPINIEFIQSKDMKIKQGSSYRSIVMLGNQKSYQLIAVTDINAIFVRNEYFHLFNIKDNSPDKMYNDDKYRTYLYQLYDGTLMVGGFDKLIWYGKKIKNKKVQVLHPYFRRYPGEYPFFLRLWKKSKVIIKKIIKK